MSISLYVHWPFCLSKCPYCDFNSHVSPGKIDYNKWLLAYRKNLLHFAPILRGRTTHTVYFGGGTPSMMPSFIVYDVLETINSISTLHPQAEITLEANPTSIEINKLKQFKSAGINRVSIGVQSLRAHNLRFLGRTHSANEAKRAIESASETFERFSFDLIYALPNQRPEEWQQELREALSMARKHLSLYQLTISKGTPFSTSYAKKEFFLPSDDTCVEMYEITMQEVATHNMHPYEISNYCAIGEESRHNLRYWEYHDYLGIGPGAHSRLSHGNKKMAIYCKYNPQIWLNSIVNGDRSAYNITELSEQDVINEIIIMGLRLRNGIEKSRFTSLTGKDILTTIPNINILEDSGTHVKIPSNQICLTDGITRDLLI